MRLGLRVLVHMETTPLRERDTPPTGLTLDFRLRIPTRRRMNIGRLFRVGVSLCWYFQPERKRQYTLAAYVSKRQYTLAAYVSIRQRIGRLSGIPNLSSSGAEAFSLTVLMHELVPAHVSKLELS